MLEEGSLLAQCPFVDITQFARDSSGGKVAWVAMDFHTVDMAGLECDLGQRGGGFRDQSLVDEILVDPVSDLNLVVTYAWMQTCPAEQTLFILIEDAIDVILAKIEHAAKPLDGFGPFFDGNGFVVRPGHPRLEMLYAFQHGLLEHLRVGWIVAADDQSLCFDAVGEVDDFGVGHITY